MTSSNHTPDTSMDEILASIRRIISEDPDGQTPPMATDPHNNAQPSFSSPDNAHIPPARDNPLSNGSLANGQSDPAQKGSGEQAVGQPEAENGIANDIARALAGGSFQDQPRTIIPPAATDVSPAPTNLPDRPLADRLQSYQSDNRDWPVESAARDATPIGDGSAPALPSFSDVLESQLRSSGTIPAPTGPGAISSAGETADRTVSTSNPNGLANGDRTDQSGGEGRVHAAPPPDPAGVAAWQNGEPPHGEVEQTPSADEVSLDQGTLPTPNVQTATTSSVDDDVLDLGTMGSIANNGDAASDVSPAGQKKSDAVKVDAPIDDVSLGQKPSGDNKPSALSGSVFVSDVKPSTDTAKAELTVGSDVEVAKAVAEQGDQQADGVDNETQPDGTEAIATGSLEGTVRDLLRPMLQSWLDTNLPRIVDGMLQDQAKSDTQDPSDDK